MASAAGAPLAAASPGSIPTVACATAARDNALFIVCLKLLGLGRPPGPCPGTCHGQDFLVVVLQGVEQFLAKYSRFLRLEHLKYNELIAEGTCVADVGRMQSDGVANDSVDVANCPGVT